MPTTEIMLSPQPFGNNMGFKCCAQLSAEPCWETNKFNKTLQDRLSNTVCIAWKNPLLYARLSPGDQWCWVRPELSTVKVLCTPAIPPHPQILWNLGIFIFFFSFPPEHCHQTLLILPQLKAQRHLSFLHHSHIISTCKRPQIQL